MSDERIGHRDDGPFVYMATVAIVVVMAVITGLDPSGDSNDHPGRACPEPGMFDVLGPSAAYGKDPGWCLWTPSR